MKEKIFNILSYFLPVTAGIIFVLFLIVFVATFISEQPIQWDFSNDGFKSFFETYSSSLQLGAAFLAVLAIMLTLERMKQTQKQIDVISDNNRFNNFYKHKEQFIRDLSPVPFIKNLAIFAGKDLNDLLSHYHRMYFAKRYDEFKPEIKESMVKNIKDFFSQIKNSNELSKDFNKEINSEDLFSLKNDWNDHLDEIDLAIDHLRNEDEWLDIYLRVRKTRIGCNNICRLCKIYYKYKIAISILSFIGEKHDDYEIPHTFIGAFEEFLDQFKLTKLKLD